MQHVPPIVIGVILAGGQSRRFGADKALTRLAGTTLVEHAVARAAGQVDRLLISATDDQRFAALGLPLIQDPVTEPDGGRAGPLAGILAALQWMTANAPQAPWLASFPVDMPRMPTDLVARLRAAAEGRGAPIACARSAGRLHPLLALWSAGVHGELRAALDRGERAAHRFIEQRGAAIVDFSDQSPDAFANVNTPDDLARLAAQSDKGHG